MEKTKIKKGVALEDLSGAQKKRIELQIRAMGAVVDLVLQCVIDTGRNGAPAGMLYASLSQFGCTKTQFDTLMSLLVEAGRVECRGHVYYSATLERDEALETSKGKTESLSQKREG